VSGELRQVQVGSTPVQFALKLIETDFPGQLRVEGEYIAFPAAVCSAVMNVN
jgi:hypothetical protein